MASRRLRFSRWRRLPPGLFRSGERRPLDDSDELQPLTIYVPGRVLDEAEALSNAFRSPSIQAFCERLLPEALAMVKARVRLASSEQTRAVLEAIDALDGGLLARLVPEALEGRERIEAEVVEELLPEVRVPIGPGPMRPSPFEARVEHVEPVPVSTALAVLLESAGLAGESEDSVVAALKRCEGVRASEVDRLLAALESLRVSWRGSLTIDRRAALALLRLQTAIVESHDAGTLSGVLRAIEELVAGPESQDSTGGVEA